MKYIYWLFVFLVFDGCGTNNADASKSTDRQRNGQQQEIELARAMKKTKNEQEKLAKERSELQRAINTNAISTEKKQKELAETLREHDIKIKQLGIDQIIALCALLVNLAENRFSELAKFYNQNTRSSADFVVKFLQSKTIPDKASLANFTVDQVNHISNELSLCLKFLLP